MRLTPDKKLHSREHLLADDLSRMLGEEKRFAAYLGIAKRYYESDLRGLARRVLEKQDLPQEARGKYFFAALRDKPRKTTSVAPTSVGAKTDIAEVALRGKSQRADAKQKKKKERKRKSKKRHAKK